MMAALVDIMIGQRNNLQKQVDIYEKALKLIVDQTDSEIMLIDAREALEAVDKLRERRPYEDGKED